MNASAVGVSVFIGTSCEADPRQPGALVNDCEIWHSSDGGNGVGREMEKRCVIWASAAASVPSWAQPWSKPTGASTSRKVVNGCPVPVVIAAAKCETERGLRFRLRRHAAEAIGINLGGTSGKPATGGDGSQPAGDHP